MHLSATYYHPKINPQNDSYLLNERNLWRIRFVRNLLCAAFLVLFTASTMLRRARCRDLVSQNALVERKHTCELPFGGILAFD